MAASLWACAALHAPLLLLADAKYMHRAPSVTLEPASITAKTSTEISFTGLADGDQVAFALDCQQPGAMSTVQNGKVRIFVEDEAEKLKLCRQAAGKAEEMNALLRVVPPSDTGAVTAISPDSVTQGEATNIMLTGAAKDSKAIFIPVREDCRKARPSVSVGANGKGLFTITSAGGNYKLCYQAPGGSDSVEQNPATGSFALKVEQVTTTGAELVTAISPTTITANVWTSISFTGSGLGDKAKFVDAASSSCEQETPPDKDVGVGHNSFALSSAGTYVLCYTVRGAADSVQQKGIALTVKALGAAQNMVGRWSSKHGNLDCSSLSQVPYCSSVGMSTCERSYAIQSGIGYKCFWNKVVWPPFCDVDMSADEPGMICQSNSCGGSPSMCW